MKPHTAPPRSPSVLAAGVGRRIIRGARYLRWRLSPNKPESVIFVSFQKCATTLFNEYVLENLQGYYHVDYESQLYHNRSVRDLSFEKRGCVFGIIRITLLEGNPIYDLLVKKILSDGFVVDRILVLLVRDPRDVLVSRYFSMGFTHGLSSNAGVRRIQERMRSEIQGLTIDEYVLAEAADVERRYDAVFRLHSCAKRSALLRYEDLVQDFDGFMDSLSSILPIEPEVREEIFKRSRPRDSEDASAHKRSGQVGGYKGKLKPETVTQLDAMLDATLQRFGYLNST